MVMGKVVKVQISVVKGQELASVFFCIGQQRVQTHHIVAEHKGVKVGRVIDVGQSIMAQGHLEHDLAIHLVAAVKLYNGISAVIGDEDAASVQQNANHARTADRCGFISQLFYFTRGVEDRMRKRRNRNVRR